MTNFDDFFNQYNGKGVDFDGYYGDQCVDLVQFWSQAIGGPRFTGNAQDIYNQAGSFYTQIANSPTAIPTKGDIVVWSSAYNGTVGHTGIATGKGDTNTFECFEQNDPTGSSSHTKTYDYTAVLGWLHPKNASTGTTVSVDSITFEELVTKSTAYDALKTQFDALVKLNSDNETSIKQKVTTIDNLNKTISDKNATISLTQQQLSSLNDQVVSLTQQKDSLKDVAIQVPQLQKELTQAENDRTQCLSAQETQNKTIAQLRLNSNDYTQQPTKVLLLELLDRVLGR